MNIEELDVVTLSDDKDYIVAKKVICDGRNYYCLVDTDNNESFKFVYEDQNDLVDLEDQKTFERVLFLMSESIDTNKLLKSLRNKLLEKMDGMNN